MKPNIDKIREFISKEKLTVSVDYIEACWKPVDITFWSESTESESKSEREDDENHGEGYYVKLVAECVNLDLESESKVIDFYVMFKNEEQFNEANDSRFDFYLEVFNEWIREWDEGYHIYDCVECEKIYKSKPENVPIIDLSDVNI